jgi:hypothetical protein
MNLKEGKELTFVKWRFRRDYPTKDLHKEKWQKKYTRCLDCIRGS